MTDGRVSDRVDTRQYPARPIVGVGAVIIDAGRVVLVRRRFEPLAGRWSLPGGALELGEALEVGAAREVLEETGLQVTVGPVIDVLDRITLDEDRRVRYHFVLVDYLCWPVGGALAAGSDVDDAAMVAPDALDAYNLTEASSAVIARGLALDGADAKAFFDSVETEKRGNALFEKARPLREPLDRNEKRSSESVHRLPCLQDVPGGEFRGYEPR